MTAGKAEKPTRFCTCCRKTKLNTGFVPARRKGGRITGYRCSECQKGVAGKSPDFARSAGDAAKNNKHHEPKHTLRDFQEEINNRE